MDQLHQLHMDLPCDAIIIIGTASLCAYKGKLHEFPHRMVCKSWRYACQFMCVSVRLCMRELTAAEYLLKESSHHGLREDEILLECPLDTDPPSQDFLTIEGLSCLEGCHRLRDVEFHIHFKPFQRVPIHVRSESTVNKAFESFTKEKHKKAQDKALTSDCISRAYAQFDAALEDLYEDKKTIKL